MIEVRDFDPGPEFWDRVLARTQSALYALPERAEAIVAALGPDGAATQRLMAFASSRGLTLSPVVVTQPSDPALARPAWFIGDIHGDLLGLEAALATIEGVDPGATVVFLGDLIDDGPYMYEVVLRLMDMLGTQPDRVCLLAGNHDEALRPFAGEPPFVSSVNPGEFATWLSARSSDVTVSQVAHTYIGLVRHAPRAIFFPDGLLATHAGIPHTDLWPSLASAADLEAPACLADFAWNRLSEDRPIKRPNRASKGCEVGYQNFFDFCALASNLLGRPVNRLIRGHDHVDAELRHSIPPKWQGRMATINNMCFALPREGTYFAPFARMPAIARWAPGDPLAVYSLKVPAAHIHAMYSAVSPEQ